MRISTRSRYGLRALVSIARSDHTPVTADTLAACEDVSKKYLDRLLGMLRRAGLVNGTKGTGGGYTLAFPPERISVWDVVSVLEDDPCLVPCIDDPTVCSKSDSCPARHVWIAAAEAVKNTLCGMTLADIAASNRVREA